MSNTPETKQPKSNPKGAGRKWFDGKDEKEVRAKLEQTAALDASTEEMCYYADISRFSLARYIEKHPNFALKIEKLRQKPVLKARQTIIASLETPESAKWYLERKRKSEFAPKQEIEHKGDVGINITAKGIFIHSAIQPARSADASLAEPEKIQGDSMRKTLGENHDSDKPVDTGVASE